MANDLLSLVELLMSRSRNVSSIFDSLGVVSEELHQMETGDVVGSTTDEKAFELLFDFDALLIFGCAQR